MGRTSSKERYTKEILDILTKRGLNVSMDVVASDLGVAKKTLYNNFTSKEEMIREVVDFFICTIDKKMSVALVSKDNAIDSFNAALQIVHESLEYIGQEIVRNAVSFLPAMETINSTEVTVELYTKLIVVNYQRGVKEGLYIPNLKIEYIARFFTSSIRMVFRSEGLANYLKDPKGYSIELTKYHLRSIVSEKGREVMNNMLKY